MQVITDELVISEIKRILKTEFDFSGDIDGNTSIFSEVIYLDSLKVALLVSELESVFNIEIDFQVVIDVGFNTVNDIKDIITICHSKKYG